MNFRTTYILGGITVAMLLGLGLYIFLADEKTTGEGFLLKEFNVAGYKDSDITALEIQRGGETLAFVRAKDRWRMTKPVEARIDGFAVDSIVRDLLKARREEKGVEIRDKKTHGLESPSVRVTLKKGADREVTVSLGNVTLGEGGHVYVLSSDYKDDRPMAVRKSTLSSLFKFPALAEGASDTAALVKGVNDFRSTKLLGDAADPVAQTASVRLEEAKKVVQLRRQQDGTWRFEQPSGYGVVELEGPFAPGNTTAVNNLRSLLQNIYNLQVASASDFIDKPEALTTYGLNADNPDLLKIEIERRAMTGDDPSGTETLLIGKPTTGPGEKFYAKLASENYVAQVTSANVRSIKGVLEDPKALRNRDLVKLDKDRVDAIDIENPSATVELRKTGTPPLWRVFDAAGNAQPASGLTVSELIEALNAQRQVIDFPPIGADDKALGFDNKAAELRIWVSGVVKEEPKKDVA